MSGRFILGIDLGTTSCKACLVDEQGQRVHAASEGYPVLSPEDGWSEQDPGEWFRALSTAAAQVLAETGTQAVSVRALALTSAAHIGVLVDEECRPLRPALLWNDQRSHAEAAELRAIWGESIFSATYNEVSTTWTLAHLAWIKAHEPGTWARLRRLYLSKDYLAHILCGASCTDPATAVSSLLYDARRGEWSEELCALVGLDPSALPEVRPVTAVVGELSLEPAKALGLEPGIPIVNGSLDSATETYCAGAVKPGDCVLRLGTAGGIHVVWELACGLRRLINYPHPCEPLWYSQAGTSAAGASLDWIRAALGMGRHLDYESLAALVRDAPPGSEGLLYHPYLAGERCPYWNPWLRGGFTGISLRHGPAHLARAVVEGVCYSLKDAFAVFDPMGVDLDTLNVVGGGTANREWLSILSAVFERPLTVLRSADSAYGAALLGLVALDNRGDPRDPVVRSSLGQLIVEPCAAWVQPYREGFRRYREAAQRLIGFHDHMG